MKETIVQRIQTLNDKYYQHNEKLESLIEQNVKLAKSGEILNAETVITRSDMQILLSISGSIVEGNIIDIHNEGLMKCKEIIAQIDKELK